MKRIVPMDIELGKHAPGNKSMDLLLSPEDNPNLQNLQSAQKKNFKPFDENKRDCGLYEKEKLQIMATTVKSREVAVQKYYDERIKLVESSIPKSDLEGAFNQLKAKNNEIQLENNKAYNELKQEETFNDDTAILNSKKDVDKFITNENSSKILQMKSACFFFLKILPEIQLMVVGFKNCFTTVFCCKTHKKSLMRMWIFKLRYKYWALFLLSIALLAIMGILAHLESTSGSQEVSVEGELYSFEITMKNCKMYIDENQDSSNHIRMNYNISYFSIDRTQSTAKISSEGRSSTIRMLSSKNDTKYCQLNIYIPKNINIDTFNFKCQRECVVVSNKELIKMEKANWQGEALFVNFRNLEISQSLEFQAETGTFQVNEFTFEGSVNLNLKNGDVILQSSNDFSINWKNQRHTFCFAGPFIENQTTVDCSISEKADTFAFRNSTSCQGSTTLCRNSNCLEKTTVIYVEQVSGNTYANLLPASEVDVSGNSRLTIFKGSPYDEGLAFEDHFESTIVSQTGDNIKEKDPIFIVDLGKRELQQSSYQKWTVVSNPSFAYLRPWWLSVFSMNLLTLKTLSLSGTLAPGICPYHFKNNLKEYYSIQKMMINYFNLSRAEVSFVQSQSQQRPSDSYPALSGIQQFSSKKPISEEWLKVVVSPELQYSLLSIDINSQNFIIPALVLSFFAAFLIGVTILWLFKIAITVSYKKIIEISEHAEKYKSTSLNFSIGGLVNKEENEKKHQNINIANLLKESSFLNFMNNVPRITSFVGFYSLILIKKFLLSSVEDFCNCLFREASPDEELSLKSGNEDKSILEMDEFKLKNYYEKFCFLNHYTEKKLSDCVKVFETFGYTLIPDFESLAFTNMIEKKNIELPNRDDVLSKEPLDVFFECFYAVSNLEMDIIFVDDYQREFDNFCELMKFDTKRIDPNILATKLGISIVTRQKLKLGRLQHKEELIRGLLEKLLINLSKLHYKLKKKTFKPNEMKVFVIEEKVLLKQFEILESSNINSLEDSAEGQEIYDGDTNKNLVDFAKEKMMFYPKWWVHELLFIIFHMIFTGLSMLPFIFLALLYEISYEPYSTINQENLISLHDIMWNPWNLPHRLPEFIEWNLGIIIFTLLFAVFNFLDDLFYFWYSSFPEDKAFLETQRSLSKSCFKKYLANFQWILIFFMVFCYASYVGLVLMWLPLGAIINPNNFLVYASSSLTFLTFVSTKYEYFNRLSKEGLSSVKKIVEEYLKNEVKEISSFLGKELSKAAITLKSDSTIKSITDFTVQKASEFGFEDEIKMIKELGENPEKVISKLGAAVNEIITDPNIIVKTFEKTMDSAIDKGKAFFLNICKKNEIPDELAEVMLLIGMDGDREIIKDKLAKFTEDNSERVLKRKLPAELVKSVLDIILVTPLNKDHIEGILVELMTNLIFFYLKDNSVEFYSNDEVAIKKRLKKMCAFLSFTDAKNTKQLFNSIKEFLVELQLTDDLNIASIMSFLEFINITVNEKDEYNYKLAITKHMESMGIPEEMKFFLLMLFMCKDNEPILDIKGERIETDKQIESVFQRLVKKYEKSLELEGKNKDDCGLRDFTVKTLTSIYLIVKGKSTKDWIREFFKSPGINHFFSAIPNNERENIQKLVSLLLAINDSKSDFRGNLDSLLKKYKVDRSLFLDIISLKSYDVWRSFKKDRFDGFDKSPFIKSIAGKINMTSEELIGLIMLLLNKITSDKSLLAIFKRLFKGHDINTIYDAQDLILFMFTKDPFHAFSIGIYLQMEEDDIILFLKKTNKLTPNFKKKFPEDQKENNNESQKKNSEAIKEEKVEKLEVKLIIQMIGDNEKKKRLMGSQVLEKLNILNDIFYEININGFKVHEFASKIKKYCKPLAETLDLNYKYFENSIFILIDDNTRKCVESLYIFLKEAPFCIPKSIVEQLVGCIRIREENFIPEYYFHWIKEYVPEILGKYESFVCKIFLPQADSEFEQSDENLLEEMIDSKDEELKSKCLTLASYYFDSKEDVEAYLKLIPHFSKLSSKLSKSIVALFSNVVKENKDFKNYAEETYKLMFFDKNGSSYDMNDFVVLFRYIAFLKGTKNNIWYDEEPFDKDIEETYGVQPIVLSSLSFYFTTNAECFSQNFVKFFKYRHGMDSINNDSLSNIISLFTLTPNTKEISSLLKISPYIIDSATIFTKLFHLKKGKKAPNSKEDALHVLFKDMAKSQTVLTWCQHLNIKRDEVILLLRLFYKLLDFDSFKSFFKVFNIGSILKSSVFFGILSLFPNQIYFSDEASGIEAYNKLKFYRVKLYELLKINEMEADFVLHIQKGEYSFFKFHTKHLGYSVETPRKENTWIQGNTYFDECFLPFFLGSIIACNDHEINIETIMEEFLNSEVIETPLNSLKPVVFYLFKSFKIHPIFLLKVFGVESASSFLKKLDDKIDYNFLFESLLDELENDKLIKLSASLAYGLKNDRNNQGSSEKDDMRSKVMEDLIIKTYQKTMGKIVGHEKILATTLSLKTAGFIMMALISKLRKFFRNREELQSDLQITIK